MNQLDPTTAALIAVHIAACIAVLLAAIVHADRRRDRR